MATATSTSTSPRIQVILAFAAVYLIWGSTYLAILYAIESLPPFFMAGTRFLIAGSLMFALARSRGAAMPTRIHWRSTLVIGGLMLMIANGGVTWSEQHVPSGIAALIVAIVPIWMVIIDWVRPRGIAPRGPVIVGLVLGLIGMVLLIGPGNIGGNNLVDPLGALALIISTLGWSTGSIYSRHAPLPDSPAMATAMEMLCGGALLMGASGITGEWLRVDLAHISLQSALAISYLIVFGSIIAFSAYVFLLKATSPAQAATYAYVNPVVAVFLGWAIAKEPLTLRTLIAAVIIVSAVAVITIFRTRRTVELAGEAAGTPVDDISPLLNSSGE